MRVSFVDRSKRTWVVTKDVGDSASINVRCYGEGQAVAGCAFSLDERDVNKLIGAIRTAKDG